MVDDLITQAAHSTGMRATGLTVRRGTELLFAPLSFALQPGQLVWLRGANGSGKTSLLRVLAGLAKPDSGTLDRGHAVTQEADAAPTQPVYLGHANALKDDLTALEALQFLATVHGRTCRTPQLEAALRRMGVWHRRHVPVRMLSQGQRRRVALARLALETQPGLWMLDEPFDALDDAGVERVQVLLCDNVRQGGTVLFTSHIAVQPEGVPLLELVLQGVRA